jgi:hypothetical protein
MSIRTKDRGRELLPLTKEYKSENRQVPRVYGIEVYVTPQSRRLDLRHKRNLSEIPCGLWANNTESPPEIDHVCAGADWGSSGRFELFEIGVKFERGMSSSRNAADFIDCSVFPQYFFCIRTITRRFQEDGNLHPNYPSHPNHVLNQRQDVCPHFEPRNGKEIRPESKYWCLKSQPDSRALF